MGMLHMRTWATLAVTLVPAFSGWGNASADDALTREVNGRNFDQFVQSALQDGAVPGAVVAISSADGTVFLKGYGVRRLGAANPVDGNTRSRSPR